MESPRSLAGRKRSHALRNRTMHRILLRSPSGGSPQHTAKTAPVQLGPSPCFNANGSQSLTAGVRVAVYVGVTVGVDVGVSVLVGVAVGVVVEVALAVGVGVAVGAYSAGT